MKKKIKLIGAAVILGMFSLGANAEGMYGSAQVAMTNIDVDFPGSDIDSGYSLIVNGGMKLDEMIDFEGVSIEAELTKSIVSPSQGDYEISSWSIGGYAAYTYPVNDEIAVKGKLGYVHLATTESETGFSDEDDSDQGISFGAAVSYAYSDEMNVVLEITRTNFEDQGVDISYTQIGIGVSMPFDM